MTVSQKDAAHLNALAEMAAKGHVFHAGDVERDDTDHAAQLFQAYNRGLEDAAQLCFKKSLALKEAAKTVDLSEFGGWHMKHLISVVEKTGFQIRALNGE